VTPFDLRREGIRTFADLAVVGAVLVACAQVLGPVRGVASTLVQAGAMTVAAAILSGPLVSIKLRAISRGRMPISGARKALLNLVQIGGYAGVLGAIALTAALLSASGLAD
jgi:hypothetical protein